MDQKKTKNFKKLVSDFRALTTKVQKENQNKTKSIKETNLVLEACIKEYQKLYLEHENLKTKTKKNEEQKKELLKYRKYYRAVKQQARFLRMERLNLAISCLMKKN